MFESKSDLVGTLYSSIGQPITQELVEDILYFILKTDEEHANQINNCMDNIHKLMGII